MDLIIIFCGILLLFLLSRVDDLHRSVLQGQQKQNLVIDIRLQVDKPRVCHPKTCSESEDDAWWDDYDEDYYDYDDARDEFASLKAQYAKQENYLDELRVNYIEEQVATLDFPELEKQIRDTEAALDGTGSPVEKSIQREQLSLLNTIYILKSSDCSDVAEKWTG